MRRNKIVFSLILIATISLVIILSGCNRMEEISIEEYQRSAEIEKTIKAQYRPVRDYGYGVIGGKKYDINGVFKNLEPLPDDIYKIRYQLMTGRVEPQTLCMLEQKYYEQPEFYLNSFRDVALKFYKKPDTSHWTPEGYGTFPHEMETITKAGTNFSVCTFFHSSWAVEAYQGFSLYAAYPSIARYKGQLINLNTEESIKYFDVEVTPDNILLEPSYPIFSKGWSKKISLKIKVADDTPKGTYAVGFDVARPSLEMAKEWSSKYQELYFSKSDFSVSEEQFRMVIVIE